MKILAIDDHELVREGLNQVLQMLGDDIDVIQADNAQEAFMVLIAHRDLDLILLDYHLPDMNGLQVLRQLGRIQPSLVVLMISGSTTLQLIQMALKDGAAGFVTKTGNTDDLLDAINQVLGGEIYIPHELRPLINAGKAAQVQALSRRQEAVLRGLLEGNTNREIAIKLLVSEETIKTHVSAILRYFDADNRTQAVRAASSYAFRVGG